MEAVSYGYVYVARVAMGAGDTHTVKAFLEAEAHDGPSLIIAYSHCIAHGIDMKKGLEQQKLLSQTGLWPLYRYNPTLADEGKNPLQLDSREPTVAVKDYAYNETRYRMLVQSDEARAEMLMNEATEFAQRKWDLYKQMASMAYTKPEEPKE
jgi:pyruvate-ferredoxin/flavodoxin oxidoreductase